MEPSNIEIITTDKEQLLNRLVDDVIERQPYPEDVYEVAAILESMGWNDGRANRSFGSDDIFQLASDVLYAMQEKAQFTPFTPREKEDFWKELRSVVTSFIRGVFFALPMAISVLAMLTLRFSLWSYEYLSLELATSIAIGTILSFMTIGGFTQAIARRGFTYIRQGFYNTARKVTFYFIKIGYVVCAAIAIILIFMNIFMNIYPFRMMSVIVLYFLFLSTIWLSVTIMYILEREIMFSALLTFGIILVYILFVLFKINIILSQIIALVIVSVIGLMLVRYFFAVEERKMEKGLEAPLPRKSIMLYSTIPYFMYGFLYFTFLFVDRVVAWSTNDSFMPYLIWFRGAYELGLDFALLMLIVPMGCNEILVNKFIMDIDHAQKNNETDDISTLSDNFLRHYYSRMIIITVVSFVCALLVYIVVRLIDTGFFRVLRSGFLSNETTHFVFIWGLLSYAILAVALMNAVTLFSMSQAEKVGRTVFISLLVNIVVGFLLSRWIDYSYAVVGLFVGSLLFMIMSTSHVSEVIRKFDYYLYFQS